MQLTAETHPSSESSDSSEASGPAAQPEPSGFGPVAPGRDRRRSVRFKRKLVSHMTPWSAGVAAVPFQVVIEDISSAGVGILHSDQLNVGVRHLLTVPRGEGERPVIRQFKVVRCARRSDGLFSIGLEVENVAPPPSPLARAVISRKTKILFLLFGIIGLAIVTFMPL